MPRPARGVSDAVGTVWETNVNAGGCVSVASNQRWDGMEARQTGMYTVHTLCMAAQDVNSSQSSEGNVSKWRRASRSTLA